MSRMPALVLLWFLLAGCDRRDEMQAAIEQGDKRSKAGAYPEAIRSYEFALDGTARTADVHYKIAFIYDDKLKNPTGAIHHYDRYLDLVPDGRHAKDAKVGKADCEKRMNLSMKAGGFMTTAEGARLQNENESLRRKIVDLSTAKATPPPPRTPNPNEPDQPPPGARRHVVAKGETLASIAFKYYQSRSQASLTRIRSANLNQLRGLDTIKPGMTLIIPPLQNKTRKS